MYNWLTLLIAYLPFQMALNPYRGVDLASIRVFILAFFGLWLLIGFWRRRPVRVKWNVATFCLLGFLLIGFISVLLAQNKIWGFRKFLFFGSIFPLYFLVQDQIIGFARKIKVVWIIVVTATIVALFGLIQFLAQFFFEIGEILKFWSINIIPVFSGFNLGQLIAEHPTWLVDVGFSNWMRAFSIYSDPHLLAFYIGLVLPLAFSLYLISHKKYKKLLLIIFFVLYLVCLLTFARGAYAAIIVSFVVMAGLLWTYYKAKLPAIFLLLCLLIFIIPGTPISYRFYTTFNIVEESNAERLQMWQQASGISSQNFLFGVGLGNYSVELGPEFDYQNPTTAHNTYLDIFSKMGIFAILIWLILIFGSLWVLFRRIKSTDHKDPSVLLNLGLLGSLIYFSVHSFFETSIYHPVIISLFLIILGIIYAKAKKTT